MPRTKIELDEFNERGFSLPVDAIMDLDFSKQRNWRPVTLRIELKKAEHLDLLRALVKRNDLGVEERSEDCKSVTLLLPSHGLSFTYRYA